MILNVRLRSFKFKRKITKQLHLKLLNEYVGYKYVYVSIQKVHRLLSSHIENSPMKNSNVAKSFTFENAVYLRHEWKVKQGTSPQQSTVIQTAL